VLSLLILSRPHYLFVSHRYPNCITRHCVSAHTVDFTKRLGIVAEDLWKWKQSQSLPKKIQCPHRSRLSSELHSRLQELFLKGTSDVSIFRTYLEETSCRIHESHLQHLRVDQEAWFESRLKSEQSIGSSKFDLIPPLTDCMAPRLLSHTSGSEADQIEPNRLQYIDLILLNSRESSVSDYLTFHDRNSQLTLLSRTLKHQTQQPVSLPSSPTFHPPPRGVPLSPRLLSPTHSYFANPSSYFAPKHIPASKGRFSSSSIRSTKPLPSLPEPHETHEVYELVRNLFTQSLLPLHGRSFLEELLQNWLSMWSPLSMTHRSSSPRVGQSESRSPPSPLLLTETSLLVTLFFLLRTSYESLISTSRPVSVSSDRIVPIAHTHLLFQQPLVFHLLCLDFQSLGCLSVSDSDPRSPSATKRWGREEIKSFSDTYGSHLDPDIFLMTCCHLGYPELMIHCLHSIFTNPLSSHPHSLPSSSHPSTPASTKALSFPLVLNFLPQLMRLEPALCFRIFCSLSRYLSPWVFQALLVSLERPLVTKTSSFESYLLVASANTSQPPSMTNQELDRSMNLFNQLTRDSNELHLLLLLEILDPPPLSPPSTAESLAEKKFPPQSYPLIALAIHLSGHLIARGAGGRTTDPQLLARGRCYEALVARLLHLPSHDPQLLLQHSTLLLRGLGRWRLHHLTIDFIADLVQVMGPSSSSGRATQTRRECEELLLETLPELLRSLLSQTSSGEEDIRESPTCECALRLLFQLRQTAWKQRGESGGGGGEGESKDPLCVLLQPYLGYDEQAEAVLQTASLSRVVAVLESALGPTETARLLRELCR
jgi:hypothetical protein